MISKKKLESSIIQNTKTVLIKEWGVSQGVSGVVRISSVLIP